MADSSSENPKRRCRNRRQTVSDIFNYFLMCLDLLYVKFQKGNKFECDEERTDFVRDEQHDRVPTRKGYL